MLKSNYALLGNIGGSGDHDHNLGGHAPKRRDRVF